jgi:shikimate dehydrogenase
MTQYINLIGYPLKHSISPDFQQAALDYYNLDIRYRLWEIEANELRNAIEQMRLTENIGANITVPYKERILGLLDEVDNQASLCGAVNTVIKKNGKLIGFNTDISGFTKALHKDGCFEPKYKNALLLGAGGAARAVGFALIQEEISSLTITNRTLDRAEVLARSLTKYIAVEKLNTIISVSSWAGSEFKESAKSSHLIVNCTTMGMRYSTVEQQSPLEQNLISSNALVYDLVYNPSQTPLLRSAARSGARTLGGLPMLIYQGSLAFELWTQRVAPVDIMSATAKLALRGLKSKASYGAN